MIIYRQTLETISKYLKRNKRFKAILKFSCYNCTSTLSNFLLVRQLYEENLTLEPLKHLLEYPLCIHLSCFLLQIITSTILDVAAAEKFLKHLIVKTGFLESSLLTTQLIKKKLQTDGIQLSTKFLSRISRKSFHLFFFRLENFITIYK